MYYLVISPSVLHYIELDYGELAQRKGERVNYIEEYLEEQEEESTEESNPP